MLVFGCAFIDIFPMIFYDLQKLIIFQLGNLQLAPSTGLSLRFCLSHLAIWDLSRAFISVCNLTSGIKSVVSVCNFHEYSFNLHTFRMYYHSKDPGIGKSFYLLYFQSNKLSLIKTCWNPTKIYNFVVKATSGIGV